MIDLITVVFRDEIPLLRIQAASINQYIKSQDIGTITVVVNDTDDIVDLIDRSWYNHHNVRVVPYSKWNYECRVNGWENQQLCKLLAASEATSAWSMVLDAKTWFICSIDILDLFNSSQQAMVGQQLTNPHFESSRKFIENLYNINLEKNLGHGPPFLFHTQTIQELIKFHNNFIDFFQSNVVFPNLITEFQLYAGFIIYKYGRFDILYNNKEIIYHKNIDHSEWSFFDEKFDNLFIANNMKHLTLALHRRAYPNLTPEQLQRWKEFLVAKNLIQRVEDFDFC